MLRARVKSEFVVAADAGIKPSGGIAKAFADVFTPAKMGVAIWEMGQG